MLVSHWPSGSTGPIITPVGASNVGTAGGAFTISLLAAAGLTTFLTDLTISCPGVVTEVSGLITMTGLIAGWNLQFVETVSAGGMYDHHWDPPLPASAANTAIVLNVPAISGGTAIAANMNGYQG